MIKVNNLTKSYGNHLAVDHLNFTVQTGQIYGFLGPNGAGKSTTMNIMTGYLAASEGEVLIDGHDILTDPEEAKRCIGYLPEMPPLYPEMTVEEYLKFSAELKQIHKEDRKKQINQVIELVKIGDMRQRLIRNLSKGYKQRVGLAQAVLGYPDIIILDEPTVGLDPQQIIEIRQLIRDLGKDHTIILSSHILAEVGEICDHILIISNGKLVASDSTVALEGQMAGAGTLNLLVKGSMGRIREILSKMPHIRSVDYENDQEEGAIQVTLEVSENHDIRERLFYAFADAKCPILDMHIVKTTLEDVFLELTQQNETEESVSALSGTAISENESKEVTEDDSDL